VSADHRFSAALRALAATMSELSIPWMVIGGVAVIAAGVPRETIDVDAAVLGRVSDVDALLETLARHGVVPRIDDARQFVRESNVLLLVHEESRVTIEISFAWLPFEEEALARTDRMEAGDLLVPIARPEDLLVYKATAWRERDRSDIERLLILHLPSIDLDRVRSLIAEIAQVLGDPGRVAAFDAMVAKARRAAC
jgi:hypothetical protein